MIIEIGEAIFFIWPGFNLVRSWQRKPIWHLARDDMHNTTRIFDRVIENRKENLYICIYCRHLLFSLYWIRVVVVLEACSLTHSIGETSERTYNEGGPCDRCGSWTPIHHRPPRVGEAAGTIRRTQVVPLHRCQLNNRHQHHNDHATTPQPANERVTNTRVLPKPFHMQHKVFNDPQFLDSLVFTEC